MWILIESGGGRKELKDNLTVKEIEGYVQGTPEKMVLDDGAEVIFNRNHRTEYRSPNPTAKEITGQGSSHKSTFYVHSRC